MGAILERGTRLWDMRGTRLSQMSETQHSASEAAPTATNANTEAEAVEEVIHLVNGMTLDERISRLLSVGEEVVTEDNLRQLLSKKDHPVCYDGFEPSGRMHIAQGILRSINTNKCTSAGCHFVFWVADWFAMMNNKMGGDLKKIRVVGEYMIEVWKAAGMNMENVTFLWSSDEINARSNEYWPLVMDIARRNNVSRIQRCGQIMGRSDGGDMPAAQIFYPCMQCADIFFLKVDICSLGMDQRKVNMLAREYCDQIKRKNKPISLAHHMVSGLLEGQEKMSKSDPNSAIFMEDSEKDVNTKIKKAFCPPGIVAGNPILDYTKHIILPGLGQLVIERKEENGGTVTYENWEALQADYEQEKVHPGDLKPAVAKAINKLIEPVRRHFETDPRAKELLKRVKAFKVTK